MRTATCPAPSSSPARLLSSRYTPIILFSSYFHPSALQPDRACPAGVGPEDSEPAGGPRGEPRVPGHRPRSCSHGLCHAVSDMKKSAGTTGMPGNILNGRGTFLTKIYAFLSHFTVCRKSRTFDRIVKGKNWNFVSKMHS